MRNEKPTIRIPRETLAECAAYHRAMLIERGIINPSKETDNGKR